MALFGRKSKRNETAACCAGNCDDESMAKAEQAKTVSYTHLDVYKRQGQCKK